MSDPAANDTVDRARVIDRVRKLMAFNDQTATEAEVENAMSLAARLMEQHAIDRADVEDAAAGSGGGASGTTRTRGESALARNLARWEGALAAAVEQAVPGVSHYVDADETQDPFGSSTQRQTFIVWYGPDQAVHVATLLFDETRLIIATLAGRLYGGCYRGRGRSYAEGFAGALYRRILRDRQASADAERVSAIVLRDEAANREWLAEEHDVELFRRPRSRGGRHFADAYDHGRRDGEEHEFTPIRPRVDEDSRRLD
jgi:hypothetical protein